MKAEFKVKYPKGVRRGDIYQFKIKKQVELEKISRNDSTDKQLFMEGGIVSGTPALVAIKDLECGKIAQVEGVLILEQDGAYIIPKKYIDKDSSFVKDGVKNAEDLIKEAGGLAEEVVNEAKGFDTQKSLGFTKKQLLVMVITLFIVVKILK